MKLRKDLLQNNIIKTRLSEDIDKIRLAMNWLLNFDGNMEIHYILHHVLHIYEIYKIQTDVTCEYNKF